MSTADQLPKKCSRRLLAPNGREGVTNTSDAGTSKEPSKKRSNIPK
jgi:hypothetical protein